MPHNVNVVSFGLTILLNPKSVNFIFLSKYFKSVSLSSFGINGGLYSLFKTLSKSISLKKG